MKKKDTFPRLQRVCFGKTEKEIHLPPQMPRQDVRKAREEAALLSGPMEPPSWMITVPNDNDDDDDYNGEAAAAADDDEGR